MAVKGNIYYLFLNSFHVKTFTEKSKIKLIKTRAKSPNLFDNLNEKINKTESKLTGK